MPEDNRQETREGLRLSKRRHGNLLSIAHRPIRCGGPNDPGVEKKRRLAEELRAAAVDAENKAHELGRQVPHGMVQ